MQIWLSHPSSINKIAFPLYLNSNANLVLTSIQVQFKTQLKVRQEDPIGGRKHPLLYAYYKITIAFCNGGALLPEAGQVSSICMTMKKAQEPTELGLRPLLARPIKLCICVLRNLIR